MAKPIVVVGSVNADLYVEIDRLPRPGETIAGDDAAVRAGGKGANQAAAAARLGGATWFAGRVGDDAFAAPLRGALKDSGVALDHLATVAGPTGQALILLQAGGENSIILVGGANQRWEGGIDQGAAARIAGAGMLLLQREIPDAANLAAARIARAHGVPVLLDLGGMDRPLPAELAELIDILSPNETELKRLTGATGDDEASLLAAARTWRGKRPASVLIKLGSRGCLLLPASGEAIAHPAMTVPVVDTTGAGDCFTAAYAVAVLDGRDERARLRFACAAAALCVQKKGAMPSMPSRAEVERLLME
ncbi:MAG TPA: ribokinase [Planctomycetota bacterium]|nr:ribokinase [Planctomycetota bacterium]